MLENKENLDSKIFKQLSKDVLELGIDSIDVSDKIDKLSESSKQLGLDIATSGKPVKEVSQGFLNASKNLTKMTIASKAAAIGMQAISMAMNVTLIFAVSAGINLLISKINEWANAQQNAIDKSKEIVETYKTNSQEAKTNVSSLQAMNQEFDKLSAGVDENGNNVSLTTDEYDRFNSLLKQIIGISPDIVASYDENGKAVLNYKKALEDAIDSQNTLLENSRREYLGKGKEIFEGKTAEYKKLTKQDTTLANSNDGRGELQKTFGEIYDLPREALRGLHDVLDELNIGIDAAQESFANLSTDKIQELYDNTDAIIALIKSKPELFTGEDRINIENILNSLSSGLSQVALIEQEQVNYLSEWAKSQDFYKDIPKEALDEFQKGLTDVNDPLKSYNENINNANKYGEEFSKAISSSSVKSIIELSRGLKDGSVSVEEYNQAINKFADNWKGNKTVFDSIIAFFNNLNQATEKKEVQSYEQLFDGLKNEALNAIDPFKQLENRLNKLNKDLEEGKISIIDYAKTMQYEMDNLDFSKVFGEDTRASANMFAQSFGRIIQGFTDLANSANLGEISLSDYTNSVVSSAKYLSALTDVLQENSSSWVDETDQTKAANDAFDGTQNSLNNTIVELERYTDSLYAMGQITSETMKTGSDDFKYAAGLIAEDLAYIVNSNGIMSAEISNTLGSTAAQIASNLTKNDANFALAQSALAENSGVAIAVMADQIGALIDGIATEISNFKAEITISSPGADFKLFERGEDGSIKFFKFDYPVTASGLKISGGSGGSLGGTVSNVIKNTYKGAGWTSPRFDNTKSNYTPSNYNPPSNSQKGKEDKTDYWKEAFDKEQRALKHQLSMKYISESQYYDSLEALNRKYFANQEKYLNEYWQYEEEVFAGREKLLEEHKKNLEEAENKINDLVELRIDYIKKQKELQKKAIDEEIKGKKKIIDLQKEAISLQKEERDYAKDLAEKQKSVTEIETELLSLKNDNSAESIKRKLELEKELAEKQTDLDDFVYDHSVEKEQEALDKEYEAFEAEKQKELDKIDEFLDNAQALREQAMNDLNGMHQDILNQLIEHNRQYGIIICPLCRVICIANYTYMQVNPKALHQNRKMKYA